MANLYLVFSHTLTNDQKIDTKTTLKVENIQSMPPELQKKWSKIEPTGNLNRKPLNDIVRWLGREAKKGDFVLIQGEFGATFYLVDFCFENELIPLYATSERKYEEKINSDGTVERKHIFKHVNFRKYIKWEARNDDI